MKALDVLIIGILAVFIGISFYIYQASHLKAGLVAFAVYYAAWELMLPISGGSVNTGLRNLMKVRVTDRWRAPL